MIISGKYKYESLLTYIKDNIDSGRWEISSQLPSEPELSRTFGISRNTIRQAMKELEFAGYVYRKQGKGTFVASRENNKSNKIALVIYDLKYMTHPFTGEMIKGIGTALEKEAYVLEILPYGAALSEQQGFFKESRYAGFILGAYQTDRDLIAEAIKKNIPFVFAKNYIPGLKINTVLIDYEKAGFLMAEHLLVLGHRKLALLNAEGIPIADEFVEGVKKAFLEKDLKMAEDDVFNVGLSPEISCELLAKLQAYSAVMTLDDDLAIKLIESFKASGLKVPEDISVTGCNDIASASICTPRLTTVRLPIRELGEKVSEKLLSLINAEDAGNNVVFQPELVVRESSAKHLDP